ncbi:hypothetical protein GGR54DRAFT_634719 [Hypoxylon sp. NC1633]|nr:hypothetical protein GGR54DRAFT_634719 [Hypoxylon sp. NC1633]
MSDQVKALVERLDPVSRQVIPSKIYQGTLVPLKTVLELKDTLVMGWAYVTRAPAKATSDVANLAQTLSGTDLAKSLPHLRRICKPIDLPSHLKTEFSYEGFGRKIHTSKSNWLYIILCPTESISFEKLVEALSTIDGIKDDIFVAKIPVPLLSPPSQGQANLWTQHYWPTIYRKNNPLGPHPSQFNRAEAIISKDASVWMTLAHQVAQKARDAGVAEPVGAVIIKRTIPGKAEPARTNVPRRPPMSASVSADATNPPMPQDAEVAAAIKSLDITGDVKDVDDSDSESQMDDGDKGSTDEKETVQIIAVAADARWNCQEKVGHTGNPLAHAALRAISMVGQKLVRAEDRPLIEQKILAFDGFQDKPIADDEETVFAAPHPSPDGYLCHDLEMYITHEPCVQCSMAILHSRMSKIVFRYRMPLTGGMCSEDRAINARILASLYSNGLGYDGLGDTSDGDTSEEDEDIIWKRYGGGRGLGLHWRKELNWTMMAWQWDSDEAPDLKIDPRVHI